MIIILILTILSLFYLLTKWYYTYWARRNIAGPKPWPIFGNFFDYFIGKKHFGDLYGEIYRSYPNAAYVGVYKFLRPALIIRDINLIQDILVNNFNSFHDNEMRLGEKTDTLFNKNPFFAKGDNWKKYRSQLTPAFTPSKIRALFPVVHNMVNQLTEYIDHKIKTDSNELEVKDLCMKFTYELVSVTTFGKVSNCFYDEKSEFIHQSSKIFNLKAATFWKFFFLSSFPFIFRASKIPFLDRDMEKWLRKSFREIANNRDEDKRYRNDILQTFLDNRHKWNFDEDTILGHMLTVLADGYETTSSMQASCLYLLAKHTDIQRKAQKIVDDVLVNSDGKFSEESVSSLDYLERILLETLRLYSPGFSINRVCNKPYTLPPQFAGGEKGPTISPGTIVIIPKYGLHYNEKHYSNPEVFDPNRFTKEEIQKRPKSSYLGFSDGPRACFGQQFAMFQSILAIAAILSKYDLKISKKTVEPIAVSPTAFLFRTKDGVWVEFNERQKVF